MRIRIKRWRRRTPDELPPAPWRQRLLVAALAVGISVLIGWAVVTPQLQAMRARADAAAPRPCAPGQTAGCVGGTMPVRVLPAPAPASAAAQ